jgi:hypothetical protein
VDMEGYLIGFMDVMDVASAMAVSNRWMHTVKRVTQPIAVVAVMPFRRLQEPNSSGSRRRVFDDPWTGKERWHRVFHSFQYYLPQSTPIRRMIGLLNNDCPPQDGFRYVFENVYWNCIDAYAPVSTLPQHVIRGVLRRQPRQNVLVRRRIRMRMRTR